MITRRKQLVYKEKEDGKQDYWEQQREIRRRGKQLEHGEDV